MEEEKKLTWIEWQLANKYIWIALLFIILGVWCLKIGDDAGGWWSFGAFILLAIWLPIYKGMIKLWNEYKNGLFS